MDFKKTIEDLGQVYTLWVRYGGENHTWNIRYIYIHKTDHLLDMRDNSHFMIFDGILPDKLKKAFALLLSTLPEGEEGRENLKHFHIYEEDLAQFGTLEEFEIESL